MTADEKIVLVLVNLCLEKLTRRHLVPAMARHGGKGDLIPAYLTDEEAQLIYGCRFLEAGGFGSILLRFHEKKRVSHTLSVDGK